MSDEWNEPEEERVSMEGEDVGPASAGGDDMENDEELVEEQEETEQGKTENADDGGDAGTTGSQINVNSFEELKLNEAWVNAAQEAWRTYINSAASREAAGEAIYAALFDSAPSLQSLFTTPRAIQAMKFMNGLNQFVTGLSDPPALKIAVETLGFGHLALDVTVPRVVIFRDAILDLFQVELGSKLTTDAFKGWEALLNYVGGAIIYIKAFYADRIKLLGESWALANDKSTNEDKFATLGSMETKQKGQKDGKETEHTGDNDGSAVKAEAMMQNVPTTFREMFQFNAAVMGFGSNMWMNEVLACFDNIVTNVSNSQRLVEECDFLVCRISKVATGKVNLAEFKSCMLASLRSLLPKDWTTSHEVAWSWLWENVERTLGKNMGMPPVWEKAYAKLLDSVDEATGFQLRRDIYLKFFALAPAGQDYFKQSNTYLHLVATKVLVMTIDIYRDPVRMVDDISALGLRHVGYAIPTEYMPPFASACVEVVQGLTQDQTCIDGFQWSIGLIAKSLVRTILEGSTIVMKSINVNTKKSMVKAISNAPRGQRATWMLLIQVGTQDISPLAWSIESGALQSASAMINDLLTFRADRDKYYYAADELFDRHPTIVQMLLNDAPGLLPELLTGLVWRSRITQGGMRRVNIYLKHLLCDPEGKFAKTLEWIIKAKDPKIVCHPVLVLLADLVWSRVACRSFLLRKSWFMLTLVVFITCQSILQQLNRGEKPDVERYLVFGLRCFIYVLSLGGMIISHSGRTFAAYRGGKVAKLAGKIPIPAYLTNWQDVANLCLMCLMIAMFCTEPVLYCLGQANERLFTATCDLSKDVHFLNSLLSMLAMFLYYTLLVDLAVFNNRVSAYVLVCGRMLTEVGLFILALLAATITFSSGLSCLNQPIKTFHGIHLGSLALLEMMMQIFDDEEFKVMESHGVILTGIFLYMIATIIFLLNLLVAQLSCAYEAVYSDMVGYARLKRVRVIVDSMPQVSQARFESFVTSLGFEKRIEFNEGDVGLNNGIATKEPAGAHPTSVDMIKRFGGSTSPSIQWPEDDTAGDDDADKFERLETLIKRSMERMSKDKSSGGKRRGGHASSTGMSGSGDAGTGGGESGEDHLEEGAGEEE